MLANSQRMDALVNRLRTICDIHFTDNMVDPSGLGHRMRIKCIECDYEKEVDNGIHMRDTQNLHLTQTDHQGWTFEHLEDW